MNKLTNNPAELKKISEFASTVSGTAIVEVTLESGAVVEGAVRSLSTGNNASSALRDGHWLYYGNFDIETLGGQRLRIDMCDVKAVRNMWEQRNAAYEEAGLIQIIR